MTQTSTAIRSLSRVPECLSHLVILTAVKLVRASRLEHVLVGLAAGDVALLSPPSPDGVAVGVLSEPPSLPPSPLPMSEDSPGAAEQPATAPPASAAPVTRNICRLDGPKLVIYTR